jgi:hypothetical protein
MPVLAVKLLDLNGQREDTTPTLLTDVTADSEIDTTEAQIAAGSNLIAEELGIDKRTAQRVQLFADPNRGFRLQLAHLGNSAQLDRFVEAAPGNFTVDSLTLSLWYCLPNDAAGQPNGSSRRIPRQQQQNSSRRSPAAAPNAARRPPRRSWCSVPPAAARTAPSQPRRAL